ncbi:MarR family winged helix-turn-helix transcriptional regulator [Gracilibacillus phocaeensis]|uniref:MarR family winged helix-turn-helix transcriptional regulator n=1 Tax=Gracilibacillus phocaeensis TaxID=2042304 RepID=UPI0010319878|nr:MarR family transcriptional regulator [Gracilibacillus phocaeensis]
MKDISLFHKFVSFSAAVHQTTHEWTKMAKPETLSQVQYKIVEYVKINQPVTPSEISDCLHMSMPNTSRELKQLKEKVLIKKSTDTNDRRKHYIQLSQQGEVLMNETFSIMEVSFQERIQQVSTEELAKMEEALDILQERFFDSTSTARKPSQSNTQADKL